MSKFEYTDDMVARMNDVAASGVTEDIIESLVDEFEFPRRSVTAKLRKLGYDVPKKPGAAPVFSADETEALAKFLEDIAEAVGKTVNSVRGKLLSMGLKAEQREKKATKSDPYEGIEDMLDQNVEDLAESFGKTVRGVKTVLTRRGLACADYTPKGVED